jgi:thioredoxin reductase
MILEQIITYGIVFLLCAAVVYIYLKKQRKDSQVVEAKIEKAKKEGLFEPVSLHPHIDLNTCIKSGACVEACPEKDIIGIVNGRATLVNASECVGHGACFHACPVEAISLVIGTEKRGVDLPHVSENYETNVQGIYIAGELGGMGLIKNSVEQGEAAVKHIAASIQKQSREGEAYDLVIIGAGPAGISASLTAKKLGLRFITLDQDSLGGTVFNFPRSKVVMTAPMDLPLYGKVKLYDTSKAELLEIWQDALGKNSISIREHTKVERIAPKGPYFAVRADSGEEFTTRAVLLAIGRRGSPRKLGIPGEGLEKVAYRLLEPENISGRKVIVVGGGDSAVEAALSLAEQNEVVLSYRGDAFARVKSKNREKLDTALSEHQLKLKLKTNLLKIGEREVEMTIADSTETETLANDLVYIFAGGELPTQFLEKTGVQITRRFGYTMRKYQR